VFNLFDIMRNAQGGAAVDSMARQFGLTVEQTQRAMEALLPAFTLGLQRSAANPATFPNLMGMLGSGRNASFFEYPKFAFSPQAEAQGNEFLGQLFGSKEVTQKVAELTAAWSGVGVEMMKQMMPVMAAMLMGGMAKSASSQGFDRFFGPFAEMFGAGSRQQPQAGSPNPYQAWGEMMGRMFGGQATPAAEPPPSSAADSANPWQEMFERMLGQQRAAAPEPRPEAAAANPFAMWGQMFETGREVQEQHLKNLQNVLDSFWGAGSGRR
jgi:hypothetical protein